MSWIQENKFTAALAGVTLVGSAALITLAMGKGDDFKAAQAELKSALSEERSLQEGVPYPNAENLVAIKSNVNDFARTSNALQRQFMAYKPEADEVKDFAPDQFSDKVRGYRNRLDKAFKASNVELPEGCLYGFEAYLRLFPRPAATGELSYQMQALEVLFSDLAKQKPEALINVVRPAIAVESKPQPGKGKGRRNTVKKDGKLYEVYPIELSFRSTEKQLTQFLEAIANNKKYYFAVNTMRVQNERLMPPNSSDARFPEEEAAPAEFDAFQAFGSGFNLGENEEESVVEVVVEEDVVNDVPLKKEAVVVASDSDERRLLMPILGSEKVNVYIKLDLIVLKQGSRLALEDRKKAQLSEGADDEA